MIKILHSADWHLGAPMQGHTPERTAYLQQELRKIPAKVANICRREQCDMLLLSGDLFDGGYTQDSFSAFVQAMEEVKVPVFIAPGNHDFVGANSPWTQESFPSNVHIFTQNAITSVAVPQLDCRVYGAGFAAMDCPALLENFRANCEEKYAIGVFHGDPTQTSSPYCPITGQQVRDSALDYLALGHIHKQGAFREGSTLCAWSGCPMGRGYDESGEKGVLLVTLDETASTRFIPLDTPRFYDTELSAGEDALEVLSAFLPPVGSLDFYRITFTGASKPLDLSRLEAAFSRFPNLTLRDRTTPPPDIWGAVGKDSFEGMYFKLLQDALVGQDEKTQSRITLAAEISRLILDGQEVVLP